MKRLLQAALLSCIAGLAGCAGDTAELTSKNAQPAAPTPPNDPSQPQTQAQPGARKELPPLGSSPWAAPGSVSPGNWR
jgi:hypothetical protein